MLLLLLPVLTAATVKAQAQPQRLEDIPAFQQFIAERADLMAKEAALRQSVANAAPASRKRSLQLWFEVNQSRMAAVLQFGVNVAALLPPPVLPLIEEVQLPRNAGPLMEQLIISGAETQNKVIMLLNSIRTVSPSEQALALTSLATAQSAAQEELIAIAKKLSAEAEARPLPESLPVEISASLPEEVRNLLVRQHSLDEQTRTLENQIRRLPVAERDAARVQSYQSLAPFQQAVALAAELVTSLQQ